MFDVVAYRTARSTTASEVEQAVKTCGEADGMTIDAADAYARQCGEPLAAPAIDGATLTQTRDIPQGEPSCSFCCLSCRVIADPEPWPGILRGQRSWPHVRNVLSLGLRHGHLRALPERNAHDDDRELAEHCRGSRRHNPAVRCVCRNRRFVCADGLAGNHQLLQLACHASCNGLCVLGRCHRAGIANNPASYPIHACPTLRLDTGNIDVLLPFCLLRRRNWDIALLHLR